MNTDTSEALERQRQEEMQRSVQQEPPKPSVDDAVDEFDVDNPQWGIAPDDAEPDEAEPDDVDEA